MRETMNNNESMEVYEAGRKLHVRDFLRKGLAAGVCAVLIGSMAFGCVVSAEENAGKSAKKAALLRAEAVDGEEAVDEDVVDMSEYRTTGNLDVSDIVEECMPSVVSITTKSVEEVMDYFSLFGYYGGYAPQQYETEHRGSGVIIGKNDEELLIVTNAHLVEGSETISVGFINNIAVEARVKGYDDVKDIAIVAVKKEDLDEDTLRQISIAKIGSSDDTRIGEQVVVIGNAMGYGQSVTTGILSAKTCYSENSREPYSQNTEEDDSAVNMLQTDAAINPGNSGGAMLNMDGELIGISCSKLASTMVEGMCYAIAISDVDDEVIEELMNEEYRELLADDEHGILGITGATVSAQEAEKYGFPEGVYISEVTEDGPADEAGIKEGDFITEFRNKKLDSINELIGYLAYYEPGEEVELTIIRDGEELTVTVTLGEQTEDYQKSAGIIREDADDESDGDRHDRKKGSEKGREKSKDKDSEKDDDEEDEKDSDDDLDDYFDEDEWGFDDIWDSWEDGLFGGY